jgi:hypothetical protein
VHAAADRRGIGGPQRRRALTAGLALAIALATAGCASDAGTGSANNAPVVTGEQVFTACVQDYFYNGILPKDAAEANCKSCVVDRLRKLGIRPGTGETVLDMLTGDRLSNSQVQTLQGACNESDANAQ